MYAVIMAGGEGRRLRPLTDKIPKPMVDIDGKPILQHQIEWLKKAVGNEEDLHVILSVNYKQDIIQKYFDSHPTPGVTLSYVSDRLPQLGTIGNLRDVLLMQKVPENEDVFVMAGDMMTSLDPKQLLLAHREKSVPFTIFTRDFVVPYGVIDADSSRRILRFVEKPPLEINTAIGIVKSDIAPLLPERGGDLFGEIVHLFPEGRTLAYKDNEAKWWHITTVEDVEKVRRDFAAEGSVRGEKRREGRLPLEVHWRGFARKGRYL